MENNCFFCGFNLQNYLMFLDLLKGWGRIQDTILLGEQCPGTRRYNPSTNWLDMWVIWGANKNVKGTEQFRLSRVQEKPHDRHQNHESATILRKMISIYCLTLHKWRPSWISSQFF